jgi:hypothetical protein
MVVKHRKTLSVGLDCHNLCAHLYQCLDRLAKVCADVEAQISGLEHGAVKTAVRSPVSSMCRAQSPKDGTSNRKQSDLLQQSFGRTFRSHHAYFNK